MGKRSKDAFGVAWFVLGFSSLIVFQSCTDWQKFIEIDNNDSQSEVLQAGFGQNQNTTNDVTPIDLNKEVQASAGDSPPATEPTSIISDVVGGFGQRFEKWKEQFESGDEMGDWDHVENLLGDLRGVVLENQRPNVSTENGLVGGSLDMMISFQVHDFGVGKVYQHIPGYDDRHETVTVDLFNFEDSAAYKLAARHIESRPFRLVIANTHLSPGGLLEINDDYLFVSRYQEMVDAYMKGEHHRLPVFRLANRPISRDTHKSDQQHGITHLKNLKLFYLTDSIPKEELHSVHPYCVAINYPGERGEYRAGAFIIQAIAVGDPSLNPTAELNPPLDQLTKSAPYKTNILWELAVFAPATGHSRCN